MAARKKVTLKHIADRAEISVSAVSMALADSPAIGRDTRKKVRMLSREMGYQPPATSNRAHNMEHARKLHRLGFFLIGRRLDDEAYAAQVHENCEAARRQGLRMEIGAAPDMSDRESVLQMIRSFAHDLDALVLGGFIVPDLLKKIIDSGIRCLVLGDVTGWHFGQGSEPVICIGHNQEAAAYEATEHLINQGHRRIAFVCEYLAKGMANHRHLAGYKLAHLEAGLPIDPSCIHVAERLYAGGAPAATAFSAMDDLPTAFFITDSRVGTSFLQSMAVRGHDIPSDHVVISTTDSLIERYHTQHVNQLILHHRQAAETVVCLTQQMFETPTMPYHRILLPIEFRPAPAAQVTGPTDQAGRPSQA